jgi:hypothetical protein
VRPAPGRSDLPRCPQLARELNSRIEAVAERVMEGYDLQVPTAAAAPDEGAVRRSAARFVRVVTAALESGSPSSSNGRAELAGYRGGFEGSGGLGVVAEHTRLALAVLQEADDAIRSGAVDEELALPCLHAIIDHAQSAVARGYDAGVEARERV